MQLDFLTELIEAFNAEDSGEAFSNFYFYCETPQTIRAAGYKAGLTDNELHDKGLTLKGLVKLYGRISVLEYQLQEYLKHITKCPLKKKHHYDGVTESRFDDGGVDYKVEPEYPDAKMYSEAIKAPKYMRNAAARGKKLRAKQPDSNKCCTPTGLARATQLVNNENLSIDTVKRIKSFAARHGNKINDDPNSKDVQALLLWGIPATKDGVERVIKWCDRMIAKHEKDS